MFSLRRTCGSPPPAAGTLTTLDAPLPGSLPINPRTLQTSLAMALSVTLTRRDQSAERSDGDSSSAPTSTMTLRNANADPTTRRNMRGDTRQVKTATANHNAMREVRVCVSTTPITTMVVQATQKSRSSRRSAHTSSTRTSGNPNTR